MSGNWSVKQRLREDVIDSVIKGDKSNTEKYLDEGADVDESQGGYLSKKTLLMLAIENKNEEIARMLVDRGADLTCCVTIDKTEKTMVQLAKEKEMDSLADLIETKQSANEELIAAAKSDIVENAEVAIEKGANINVKLMDPDQPDLPNASLVMLAICYGSINVARFLIEKEANLTYTIQCEDKSGGEPVNETARTLSIKKDLDEITQLIDDTLKKQHIEHHKTKDAKEEADSNGNTVGTIEIKMQ
ncbi:uncharacterized protein [Antedon mediterranea]|uniref:uncharacterized protein isoform X2 n=1 Tax=Antedon mediterranea TaxID=105859 RepID=UPI003AF43B84